MITISLQSPKEGINISGRTKMKNLVGKKKNKINNEY
jgi:hypothetical protein